MNKTMWILATALALGSLIACHQRPEDAMRQFYANQAPECNLEDPLWTAGDEVVPLVLVDVVRKDMPRRRYAISFLGNVGDRRSLRVLEAILRDSTENDLFRADALEAIHKIDPARGAELARENAAADGLLGQDSNFILEGGEFERYGFWDRMLGLRCR